MVFQARHGVNDWEKAEPQRFEVDVELALDLQPAGLEDDLDRTVDYRGVYEIDPPGRRVDDVRPHRGAGRGDRPRGPGGARAVEEVVVRVRKPEVQLGGPLDYAGVEIRRARERAEPGRARTLRGPSGPGARA